MSSNPFTALGAFEVAKLATLAVPLWLLGCAVGPNYRPPEATVTRVPAAWHAKVPHGGTVAELNHWWARGEDPALGRLVEAAEQNSPTLALAVGRVRAARAGLQASRASFMPALFGSGSYNRDKNVTQVGAVATTTSGVLSASWEIDIFGGARRNYEASQAQFSAAEFGWYDARVTLAAEVANSFTTARLYQNLIARYELELASRRSTQELTAAKVREGMLPPTTA